MILKRWGSSLLLFVTLFLVATSSLAAVCSNEKIDNLVAIGLTENEIAKICTQPSCSDEKVSALKAEGLNDCEIGRVCPGHFEAKLIKLQALGLVEPDLEQLYPNCYNSTPDLVTPEPETVLPEPGVGTDGDRQPVIAYSKYTENSAGTGRLDIEVVLASAFDGLLKAGFGVWYKYSIYIDDEEVSNGKVYSTQNINFSKEIAAGKHEVKVELREVALIILPSAKKTQEFTLNIRERFATILKIHRSDFYKKEAKSEDS